jgi:hypothetical protein
MLNKVDIAEHENCSSVAMIEHALNHVGGIDFRAEK